MSRDAARFQARSAFTGAGYTTQESESVTNHPVRRRIVLLLMLLGNVGIATVVATIMLSMLQTARAEHWWWHVTLLVGGLAVLVILSRSRRVEYHLNRVIAFGLKRWTDLEVMDYVAVLQLQNGYAVTEMLIVPGNWLAGKSLAEAALAREGVLVLGVEQPSGVYLGAPRGGVQIRAGDTLILYGRTHRLAELDQRPGGDRGDRAHRDAMLEYENDRRHGEQPA